MNEDIELTIIDLGDLLHTKSHKEILEFLKDKQLQLGESTFGEAFKHRTSTFALTRVIRKFRPSLQFSTNHCSAVESCDVIG